MLLQASVYPADLSLPPPLGVRGPSTIRQQASVATSLFVPRPASSMGAQFQPASSDAYVTIASGATACVLHGAASRAD